MDQALVDEVRCDATKHFCYVVFPVFKQKHSCRCYSFIYKISFITGSMISEGGLSGLERGPGVGQTRPPSFHGPRNNMMVHQDDLDEDTESAITSVSQDLA